MTDLLTVPLALAIVLSIAWLCGRLATRLKQPAVIGEMIAGLVLGPSVFGAIAPELAAQLFTPSATAALVRVGQTAVLVFIFLIGIELDLALLRTQVRGVATIALSSLVLPFLSGCALAVWIHPTLAGRVANRTAFILFIGTVMSITAVPVLTRILRDWRMIGTTIGTIAIGCAAVDDVVAWTMLGLVVGLVRGQSSALTMVTLTVVYFAVMLYVVRPMLRQLARHRTHRLGQVMWVGVVVAVVALSAIVTDQIGLHAVFGAFVAGTCMPRQTDVLEGLEHPLHRISQIMLPAFFVLIGLKTQIAFLAGTTNWIVAGAFLLCASAGKLGGAAAAARMLGFAWRDALAIGALLNTRGLVALVALDIGRNLEIVSPPLYAILVIMILLTTLMTVPVLRALHFGPLPENQEG